MVNRGQHPIALLWKGFRQTGEIRHFLFQRLGADAGTSTVMVDANVELMRRYGLPMQEMPLLCRRLLESQTGDLPEHVDYTEEAMRQYATGREQESEARQLKRGRTGKPTSTKRRSPDELSRLGGVSDAI